MTHAIKPAVPENAGGRKTWSLGPLGVEAGPRALGLGSAVTAIRETVTLERPEGKLLILIDSSEAWQFLLHCFTDFYRRLLSVVDRGNTHEWVFQTLHGWSRNTVTDPKQPSLGMESY